MRDDVVALYVDPKGPYPKLVKEWYDEKRDARTYKGPWPVVAHPPCHLWTNFAALNFKRWGGEHNRPGNDGGRFGHALSVIRKYGGVIEHPAYSKAWETFDLPKPEFGSWHLEQGLYVTEVWQSAYGHKARKKTWLLYASSVGWPKPAIWAQVPGTHQCGHFDRIKPVLSKRAASLTPPRFAEYLLDLAGSAEL